MPKPDEAQKIGTYARRAITAIRKLEKPGMGEKTGYRTWPLKPKRLVERMRVKAAEKGIKLTRSAAKAHEWAGRYPPKKPLKKLEKAVGRLAGKAGGKIMGIATPVKAMTEATQKQEYKQKVKGLESLRGKKLKEM